MTTRRVIVAEPWQPIAELEVALLGSRFRVESARDPESCFHLCLETGTDAILIGGPMFDAGGKMFLLQRIVNVRPALTSKIIVVTKHVLDHAYLEYVAEVSVFAVIAKPFDVNVLVNTVEDCIRAGGTPGATRWIEIPNRVAVRPRPN